MTQIAPAPAALMIDDMPWPENPPMPPANLPYEDGEKMEQPWHSDNHAILKGSYFVMRGRKRDYYMGANMFVYYSSQQIRNKDYKGPDVFIVNDTDGERERDYWAIWDEDGRYPEVIFEFLSPTTEREDLGPKKRLYEQRFRTREYFCITTDAQKILGWRFDAALRYEPIAANERGWLWSEQVNAWVGVWEGAYLGIQRRWVRFYHADGTLAPMPDEEALLMYQEQRERADAEQQRADAEQQRAEEAERQRSAEQQRAEEAERQRSAEQQRADDLAARLAALEAALRQRGDSGESS